MLMTDNVLALHGLLRKRGQVSEGHFDANLADHKVDQTCFLFSIFPLRHQPARLGDNQYEPVDRVEVAKLLGSSDHNKSEKKAEHESPSATVNMLWSTRKTKR